MMNSVRFAALWAALLSFPVALGACVNPQQKEEGRTVPSPELLRRHCEEYVGPPRVEQVSEHVWVALGYDLANTVLIHTGAGNVIVDPAMSPLRAGTIRAALEEAAPAGPVKAVIYTHSHIDHVGGASVWAEEGTAIWATEAFEAHFFKQYGLFRNAETVRAMRQFGHHLSGEALPCSALGARMDIAAALESGVRLPTHTFSGFETIEIDGLTIELHEGHGETHDQLFVWIPSDGTLIPGDNFYWSFPNLYSIRGTSPRPIDAWIGSLDGMRRKGPAHLVPTHTRPIHGKRKIAETLADYRDAIQWVRDAVVRGANRGETLEAMAETIRLPAHLADKHYLQELYGQVDWSVRAIYTNRLGWFDGGAQDLYSLPTAEVARREVGLLGGPERVLAMAEEAMQGGDVRWAIHLLAKLDASGLATGSVEDSMSHTLSACYRRLAEGIANTNGRAYLLEAALEIEEGPFEPAKPKLQEQVVSRIPLELIFSIMSTRLIPEGAMDVHETVYFRFPDEGKQFVVTVRRGVAEVVAGEPLPGTPEPVAILETEGRTYRRIAVGVLGPVGAYAAGSLKVRGSWLGLLKFLGRFERGL